MRSDIGSDIDFLDAGWYLGLTNRQKQCALEIFMRAEAGLFSAPNWRAFCAILRSGTRLVSATLAALVDAGRAAWETGTALVRLAARPAAEKGERAADSATQRKRNEREAATLREENEMLRKRLAALERIIAQEKARNPNVTPAPLNVTNVTKTPAENVTSFFASDNPISDSDSLIQISDSIYKISESDSDQIQRVLPADLSDKGREMLKKGYSAEVVAEAERRMTEKGVELWKERYLLKTCRTVKDEWDAAGQQAMPLPMLMKGAGRASPQSSPAPRPQAESRVGGLGRPNFEPFANKPPQGILAATRAKLKAAAEDAAESEAA